MSGWTRTPALSRALVVSLCGLAGGLLLGEPAPVVLAAPFALLAGLAMAHRPRREPVATARAEHTLLHEGQATRLILHVRGADEIEQVTRVVSKVAHTTVSPRGVSAEAGDDGPWPEVVLRADRWGRRQIGEERVALFSRWGGYRWGPRLLTGSRLTVLPVRAPFDLAAEAPQPDGLVGPHRSRRPGEGTELHGIRPFASGDRLRRIHWRESLRSGDLHVVTTRAEQDSAVLLLLDGLADLGRSDGIEGQASSLDLSVRAAAALAAHHLRLGDRVGLRVLQSGGAVVPFGSGGRHLQRLEQALAGVRPDARGELPASLRLGLAPGTVVYLLSPLLAAPVATTAVHFARQGLPALAIDTLPDGVRPLLPPSVDSRIADLAWRVRSLERDELIAQLTAAGVPVTPWRGPGTLDEVLRQLSRRAGRPRVRA